MRATRRDILTAALAVPALAVTTTTTTAAESAKPTVRRRRARAVTC